MILSEEDHLVSVGQNIIPSSNGILILAGQGKPGFNQTMFDTDILFPQSNSHLRDMDCYSNNLPNCL